MDKRALEEAHFEFTQLDFSHSPILFCIRQSRTMLKRLLTINQTQGRDKGEPMMRLRLVRFGFEMVEDRRRGHIFRVEELGVAVEALAAPALGSDVKIKVEVRNERGIVLLNHEN